MEQVHDLAEGGLVGDRTVAVAALAGDGAMRVFLPGHRNDGQALELAAVLLALERPHHLVHEIVNVEELQFHGRIVDSDREAVGDVVAECRDGAVVVRTAPFAVEVREAVHEDLRARLTTIFKEQVLAGLLAAAVLAVAEAAGKGGLRAGREHHRAGVAVFLEGVQERAGEAEVALHELILVLGAVHTGEIEDEVGLAAVHVQILRGGIDVIFIDLGDLRFRLRGSGAYSVAAGLAVANVLQLRA